MANEIEVAELLDVIRDFYGRDVKGNYRFNPSQRIVVLWSDDLSDLPIEALWLAFKQYRNSPGGEWPPSPGQLREHVTTMTRPALPTWGEAWEEVLNAIRRVGYTGQPAWSHPLIEQAVSRMGGWRLLCHMTIEETGTQRAQFRTVYESCASRVLQVANLLPDVRALAVRNGALPAPVEPPAPALPAPAPTPTAGRDSPPRPIADVLPAAVRLTRMRHPKDEYRERVRRAQADPTGPEAQAFVAQAEKMRQAALAWANRRESEASDAAV